MATFWSGNGGYTTVGATRLDVAKWTVNSNARLTENTNSGTAGSTRYDLVAYDNSSSIEIPWDSDNLPSTLLPRGSKVTLTFYHGGSTKTSVLTNTTVENVTTVDDNAQDIVRVSVTTKGGVYTAPT